MEPGNQNQSQLLMPAKLSETNSEAQKHPRQVEDRKFSAPGCNHPQKFYSPPKNLTFWSPKIGALYI